MQGKLGLLLTTWICGVRARGVSKNHASATRSICQKTAPTKRIPTWISEDNLGYPFQDIKDNSPITHNMLDSQFLPGLLPHSPMLSFWPWGHQHKVCGWRVVCDASTVLQQLLVPYLWQGAKKCYLCMGPGWWPHCPTAYGVWGVEVSCSGPGTHG